MHFFTAALALHLLPISVACAQTVQEFVGTTPKVETSKAQSTAVQKKNPIDLLSSGFSVPFSSLAWNTLSPVQQAALKPLANTWENLSDQQKRKWISVCSNYPRMTADEQTKLHTRMKQWAALSPRQREQARLNFAEVQKTIPPSQVKNEQWQAYQSLSPEEQKKLAKSAQSKPPRTALAAQPAPPNKLHQLPLVTNPKQPDLPASAQIPIKPLSPMIPTIALVPDSSAAHVPTGK